MNTQTGYIAVTALGLIALGLSLVDYLKFIVNLGDKAARSAFVSQTVAYLVFVVLVVVAAQANQTFATVQFVQHIPLSKMDGTSLVLIGLILGGAAGTLRKYISARDNTDSAAAPPFLK